MANHGHYAFPCLMENCPDKYKSDLDMRAHLLYRHGKFLGACSTGIAEELAKKRFVTSLSYEWMKRKQERFRTSPKKHNYTNFKMWLSAIRRHKIE